MKIAFHDFILAHNPVAVPPVRRSLARRLGVISVGNRIEGCGVGSSSLFLIILPMNAPAWVLNGLFMGCNQVTPRGDYRNAYKLNFVI